MSNSTRPGGYDERFVVPPEASRRGAHRARVSPFLSLLPLLAVAVLVIGVVALAYTFLSGSFGGGGSDQAGTAVSQSTRPTATGAATPSGKASETAEPGATPSESASRTAASPTEAAGEVDKSIRLAIFNGTSPTINGLAAKAATTLKADGWAFKKPATWQGSQISRTTVFYADRDQLATAKAVIASLGTGVARQSAAQAGSGITVVVSNDWQP